MKGVFTSIGKMQMKPTAQNRAEVSIKCEGKVVVFFIGGAGDKERYYFSGPNHNIEYCLHDFNKKMNEVLKSLPQQARKNIISDEDHYFGYYEVYISKNKYSDFFKKYIPSKDYAVYVVGHSLGGWNGAYLTEMLSDNGYSVRMLVTLDPVGRGVEVETISNIPYFTPFERADKWVNVRCMPSILSSKEWNNFDFSDFIADVGFRWHSWSDDGSLEPSPDIDLFPEINHYNALAMFSTTISPMTMCIRDYMIQNILWDLCKIGPPKSPIKPGWYLPLRP